jgi:hypothetical protein
MFKYLKILKFHLSYGYKSHTHVFNILSVLKTMFCVSLEADLSEHLHGGSGLSMGPVCVSFNIFRRSVILHPLYEPG